MKTAMKRAVSKPEKSALVEMMLAELKRQGDYWEDVPKAYMRPEHGKEYALRKYVKDLEEALAASLKCEKKLERAQLPAKKRVKGEIVWGASGCSHVGEDPPETCECFAECFCREERQCPRLKQSKR